MTVGYVNLINNRISEVDVLDKISNVSKAKRMSVDRFVNIKYATFVTTKVRVLSIYNLKGDKFTKGVYRNGFKINFDVGKKIDVSNITYIKNTYRDITYYGEIYYTSREVAHARAIDISNYTGTIEYRDPYGIVVKRNEYKKGKFDGISIKWGFGSSKEYFIAHEDVYTDGNLNGRQRRWCEIKKKTILMSDHNYLNNIKNGIYKTLILSSISDHNPIYDYKYFENGIDVSKLDPLDLKYQFTGYNREYDKDGQLMKECRYNNGIPNGTYRKWNMVNGLRILTDSIVFNNGTPNGECFIWDPNKQKSMYHIYPQ